MGILNETEESNEFTVALNSRLVSFQEKIDELEYENSQYKITINELGDENINKNTSLMTMKNNIDEQNELVIKLNSKIENYEGTIKMLVNENSLFKNDMMLIQDKNISKQESLINELEGDKNNQKSMITTMKIEIDESNDLINTLNSKVVNYEKQFKTIEQENSKYQNEITSLKMENNNQQNSLSIVNNEIDGNSNTVKILVEENEKHKNIISDLRLENKLLEKKSSVTTNESLDNLVMITEIESENEEMRKQIGLLHSEIKQKHERIETLNEIQKQKDIKISQIQAQKSEILEPSNKDQINNELKQNDVYLVELNYLKAKGLVNDEEIETLRAENEEYRILLNLLKKGQDSVTGIDNLKYNSIDGEKVQGVVIYKTTEMQKYLPNDWIAKIDNSKKYTVYIEPTPKWSKDMSSEINESLDYWTKISGVQFEITKVPSFGIISVGWEKELQSGYDGYVVGQTSISIGLGSTDCDSSWRPYTSESIKNILIHEIGHTIGLDHAVSKSNIMYPIIYDAKFAAIEKSFTIAQNDSLFIKGCSFTDDPSYKYKIEVENSKTVDIFFVPSIEEKNKIDAGKAFDYYSDINCLGLDKSFKTGICKVADSAGMLIINSDNQDTISLKVYLEEQ